LTGIIGGLSRSWESEGIDLMVGAGQHPYQQNGWAADNKYKGRLAWVMPRVLSDSSGAGVTEYYDTEHFFRGPLRIYTLSEEVPLYRVEDGIKKTV